MRIQRMWQLLMLAALCCLSVGPVRAAQEIRGTLVSSATETNLIRVQTEDKTIAVSPDQNAKILRGQLGKELREVQLKELAPGDRIVAIVNQNGRATSIKAFFGIVRGALGSATNTAVTLDDGRKVPLNSSVQVVLPDGSLGKASAIRPGTLVICRVNPLTNEAWTVVATATQAEPKPQPKPQPKPEPKPQPEPKPAPKPETAAKTEEPTKTAPTIQLVKYSPASPLKPGQTVSVELKGTAAAEAEFEVTGLLPSTKMKEDSPGIYKAQVQIPAGKPVRNAPLIGRLAFGTQSAAPVQASRLITVEAQDKPVESAPPPAPPIEPEQPAQTSATARETVVSTPETKEEDVSGTMTPGAPQSPPEADTVDPKVVEPPAVGESAPDPAPVVKVAANHVPGSIVITSPVNGSRLDMDITVRGTADPDSKVRVTITYTNQQYGLLELRGQVCSEVLAAAKNGQFSLGPIALEGRLASKDLVFTIKASYAERNNPAAVAVTAYGNRR